MSSNRQSQSPQNTQTVTNGTGTTASRKRWIGLVFISLSVALIIVDTTIVNVAIPSIVDDIGINSTQVQWVQESYTLVFAALLLLFGALADRWGRRLMLVAGLIIFGVASVFAALAATGDLLILSRLLQGLGGAMVMPTTLSLINVNFQGRERGIAFAVWGSTIGGMVAVGPLLGGWLTTYFSWRWAFGINIPLVLIIVTGVLLVVAESREPGAHARIDGVGAIFSVVASATLVFGLIEGRTYGWWLSNERTPLAIGDWQWPFTLSPIPIVLAISVCAIAGFVAWGMHRERTGKSSLLAITLFRMPSFRNGNIAAMIVSLGEFGIILSLPLWLQNVAGYNALQTGFVLVALALGSFIASGISGVFLKRSTPIVMVRTGVIAEMIGIAALGIVLTSNSGWVPIVLCLFVYGFGIGLATAQLTGVVLQDVPIERSGQGSGTQSTARQIGSALGIAILGTVLFTSTGSSLDSRLEAADPSLTAEARQQVVDTVVASAGAAIPGLAQSDPAAAEIAREAFTDGTKYSAFAASGFLVIGLLATLRLSSPVQPVRPSQSSKPAGPARSKREAEAP